MVVTITRGGYAKRTRTDLYRVQKRGGKGVRGASLRADDEVDHLFATTNHHWILFFTNKGGSTGRRCGSCPRPAGTPRAATSPGCCPSCRTRNRPGAGASADYRRAVPAAGHQARPGQEDRAAGSTTRRGRPAIIAVNFREDDDELIGAELCAADDEVLLISRKGQSIRFPADDDQLRPMGRATSGVTGMKFRHGDELLSHVGHRCRPWLRTAGTCSR